MSVMKCPHCNSDGHTDGMCHNGGYYVEVRGDPYSVWICERGEGQAGSCSQCVESAQERDNKCYEALSSGGLFSSLETHTSMGLVACRFCHGDGMVMVNEYGQCFPFTAGGD